MSLQFPASPTVGQVFPSPLVPGAPSWTFDGSKWVSGGFSGAVVSTSPLPPTNPRVGDLWFDPSEGQTYVWFDDGVTAQWVVTINQTGQTNMVPEPPQDGQVYLRGNGAWVPMTTATAVLTADIILTASTWANAISVNVGTVGTWFVSANASQYYSATQFWAANRIWDGTTLISYAESIGTTGASTSNSLSGIITNPVGPIVLQGYSNTPGRIKATGSLLATIGNITMITAIRIG